jgi:hypothetical protein
LAAVAIGRDASMSVTNPNGHVKIYRQIENSQVWRNAELLKVWLWCLLRASYLERWVDAKTGKGTTQVHIMPGQFIFGRFEAAEALQQKASSVRNRMAKLKKMGNLVLNVDTHWTLVTVCNWATYQAKPNENGQADGHATATQRTGNGQAKDTNKKVKKEEEGKEGEETEDLPPGGGKKVSDSGFSDFWKAYPRKVGKGNAERAWHTAVKKAPQETILAALETQRPVFGQRGKKFIPHPATWLNGRRWEDDVAAIDPEPDTDDGEFHLGLYEGITCTEEDCLRVSAEIFAEMTPEQQAAAIAEGERLANG